MLFKTSKPLRLAVPAFALLTLTGLYTASQISKESRQDCTKITEEKLPVYQATIKYRYDEMAHKLVMEYGHQTRGQLNKRAATGFGNALRNVAGLLVTTPTIGAL